jgi:hypothetical protein
LLSGRAVIIARTWALRLPSLDFIAPAASAFESDGRWQPICRAADQPARRRVSSARHSWTNRGEARAMQPEADADATFVREIPHGW